MYIPAMVLAEATIQGLLAIKVVLPVAVISLAFVVVNGVVGYALIHGGVLGIGGLGFIGSPLAAVASRWLYAAAICAYAWCCGAFSEAHRRGCCATALAPTP